LVAVNTAAEEKLVFSQRQVVAVVGVQVHFLFVFVIGG